MQEEIDIEKVWMSVQIHKTENLIRMYLEQISKGIYNDQKLEPEIIYSPIDEINFWIRNDKE